LSISASEHLGQGGALGHVAGEHLGATYEAAAVEHEAEGDQRAIGTFLFRPAAGGFGVSCCGALEIGVGQIVERHGDRQAEQVLDAAEQRLLDRVAVTHEQVGGAVEAHRRHGFEVSTQ
jgi:hypothetical protein